ncbi:MAG: hypothetical protein KDD53_10465, partial [Bdellovibrionales bacterium]|nr:hypothetical protein [Bdellovibrionales bacterium]
ALNSKVGEKYIELQFTVTDTVVTINLPPIQTDETLSFQLSNDNFQTVSNTATIQVIGYAASLLEARGEVLSIESRDSEGALGNAKSLGPFAIGGQFIAFQSQASNLVATDTNGFSDIFVRDRLNKTTIRVSESAAGAQANNASSTVALSETGRFVGFYSQATNLGFPDVNNKGDYFIVDRDPDQNETFDENNNQVVRINLRPDGIQSLSVSPGFDSYGLQLSDSGRFALIVSTDSDLVPNDLNIQPDVFLVDRDPDENGIFEDAEKGLGSYSNRLISSSSEGIYGNGPSTSASMSGDSRYIVFESAASNLVAGDSNLVPDVFLKDTSTDKVVLLSRNANGIQGNAASTTPHISKSGRYITFVSSATNLVPGAGEVGISKVFLIDQDPDGDGVYTPETSSPILISRSPNDGAPNEASLEPKVTDNGPSVVFKSLASNLVEGDTNARSDIFLWEGNLDQLRIISVAPDGSQSVDGSSNPSINDELLVTFDATGLVDSDVTSFSDLYL